MCEYCNGEKVLYQETINTKIFINTLGEATALITETMSCPPYSNCCMKNIPARSAFIIKYCPECGEPLTEPKPLTLE